MALLAFLCAVAAAFISLLVLLGAGVDKALWWWLMFMALYFAFHAWPGLPSGTPWRRQQPPR